MSSFTTHALELPAEALRPSTPHMADDRARRQIAFIAAQLMYQRTESEYFTAQRKAARQLGMGDRFRPGGLPSNAEIRDQIRSFARLYDRRPGCLEWRPRAGYDGPDEFE